MTKTLSNITARKSLGLLPGLFSLALLLFSSAGVYAQDKDASVSKLAQNPSLINTETSKKPDAKAASDLEDKIALRNKIQTLMQTEIGIGIVARNNKDDLERINEAGRKVEAAKREYKERFKAEYNEDETKEQIKPEETRTKGASIPLPSPLDMDGLPDIDTTRYRGFTVIYPEEMINIETQMRSTIRRARALSPQINLLDAATRKSGTDNPDNKKLRAAFLEIKGKFEQTMTDWAKLYVKFEANPNADQSVVSSINSELSKGDYYFTERFWLEVNKLKNLISDADYQLKKTEIDDRYAQKYMLAAASLRPDDVVRLIAEVALRVQDLRERVGALEKIEPIVTRWVSLAATITLPLLMYLMHRRKDWRENEEFKLLELKKRQLEQQIEEKEIELARLRKTEIIVLPTAEDIKKYSAPAFFRQSDENEDERSNYFGH